MLGLPFYDYVFHKAGRVYRVNQERSGLYVVNSIMLYNKFEFKGGIIVFSNSVTNFPYPLTLNATPKDEFKRKAKGVIESVLDPSPIELLNYDKFYTLIDGCNQEVIVTPSINGYECEGEVYPNLDVFGNTIKLSGNKSASNRTLRIVKKAEAENFEPNSLKRVIELIDKGYKFFDDNLNEVKVKVKNNQVLCKDKFFENISFLGDTITLKRKANSLISEMIKFTKEAEAKVDLKKEKVSDDMKARIKIDFSKAKFFKNGERYDVSQMSDGAFLINDNMAFSDYETCGGFCVTFKTPVMGKKDSFTLYYAYSDKKLDAYDMLMLEERSLYFFDYKTDEYVNLVKHENGTYSIGDKTYTKCRKYYDETIRLENSDEYKVLHVFNRTYRARDIVIDTITKVKYCDNAYVKVDGGHLFVSDSLELRFCNEDFDNYKDVKPVGIKGNMFIAEVDGHLKLFKCRHQYKNETIQFETYNFAENLSELYVKFTKHLKNNGLINGIKAEIKESFSNGLIIKDGEKEYTFADITKLEIREDCYIINVGDNRYKFHLYNRVSKC